MLVQKRMFTHTHIPCVEPNRVSTLQQNRLYKCRCRPLSLGPSHMNTSQTVLRRSKMLHQHMHTFLCHTSTILQLTSSSCSTVKDKNVPWGTLPPNPHPHSWAHLFSHNLQRTHQARRGQKGSHSQPSPTGHFHQQTYPSTEMAQMSPVLASIPMNILYVSHGIEIGRNACYDFTFVCNSRPAAPPVLGMAPAMGITVCWIFGHMIPASGYDIHSCIAWCHFIKRPNPGMCKSILYGRHHWSPSR